MSEPSIQYIASLADQISGWRRNLGLTQSELESKAGLAHNALSRIETGQVSPRIETIEKIALALGMGIEELQFRAPPNPSRISESNPVEQLVYRIQKLNLGKRQAVLEAFNKLLDQMETE